VRRVVKNHEFRKSVDVADSDKNLKSVRERDHRVSSDRASP
jgi:hypothetical protein